MRSLIVATALCASLGSVTVVASEPAPRFDYSTEQSMRESNRLIAQHLPADRREALKAAIVKLGVAAGVGPYVDANGERKTGISPETIRKIVHGKTAEEIIALAEKTPGPTVTFGTQGQ
jgi:hypothetical protein